MIAARPSPLESVTRDEREPEWHWPVDLMLDNRDPDLSSDEAVALAELVRELDCGCPWPAQLAPVLRRLFWPVESALIVTGAAGQVRTAALRQIAREMQRRQRTPGGWSSEQWIQTLGTTERRFRERHRGRPESRQHLIALAYLLDGFQDWSALGTNNRIELARKIFGQERIDTVLGRVLALLARLGYRPKVAERVRVALCEALLINRSPRLADLTVDLLDELRARGRPRHAGQATGWYVLSQALSILGFLDRPLSPDVRRDPGAPEAPESIAPEWVQWCARWRDTSPLPPPTRNAYYRMLLQVGRWVTATHPEVTSPTEWTREITAAYVAAVDRMVAGQYSREPGGARGLVGKPLSARTKATRLTAVRAFFRDCQEWGWFARRFDPRRCFATPRAILALLAPNPRVIADDIWAKLLWAGLNLSEADLLAPVSGPRGSYPFALVRAVTVLWLFGGLRRNEIRRLRVGCIRWQGTNGAPTQSESSTTATEICLLDVPPHKTGPAFTKPVDHLVGEAIGTWEQERPDQPLLLDPKTGELVSYLFAYRGRRIGVQFLNETLIPVLCHKAGVPDDDARGAITSHRARATIATQLFNAREPFSLFELQAWLGHRSPNSTQHYAKLSPTKLAKAYAAANYFARNVRAVEVLIDQESIKSGAATEQPWKFYDLGHGYCSYDFFDQCPHRMACVKCAFYVPKGSSRAQTLEGRANLLRMLQEIPLTEDERAAVDDGVAAFDCLLTKLADLPTPDGLTPRQLAGRETIPLRVVPTPNNGGAR